MKIYPLRAPLHLALSKRNPSLPLYTYEPNEIKSLIYFLAHLIIIYNIGRKININTGQ